MNRNFSAEEEVEDDGPVDNSGDSEDGPPKVIVNYYTYFDCVWTMKSFRFKNVNFRKTTITPRRMSAKRKRERRGGLAATTKRVAKRRKSARMKAKRLVKKIITFQNFLNIDINPL